MNKSELLSKAKPILFNTPMVQAILEDRKTKTRRIVKENALSKFNFDSAGKLLGSFDGCDMYPSTDDAPYHFGDILYVRETWCWCPCWDCGMDTVEGCYDETAHKFYNIKRKEWGCYGYKASWELNSPPFDRWRPSIHMPKEAARIFLRVTDVSVERLQDITEAQAIQEGAICFLPITFKSYKPNDSHTAQEHFRQIWDSTIKKSDYNKYGWYANPWVWVIDFERLEVS